MDTSPKINQNEPDRTKGVPFRVFLITAFVAFGGFLFGYECVIGGQLIQTPKFSRDYGTIQESGNYGFSPSLTGAFVSILSCGTFFGALSASQFCDRLGRKWGIIATCVVFSIGVVIQILAPTIGVLLAGRFIAGLGVGLISVMIPLYQSECVPAHRRGTIVSCYQLAITIGLLIGQMVTNATKDDETKRNYRLPIGLQLLWSTVLMMGMFFFPETPRFLIRAGKWEQAIAAKVRLSGLKAEDPQVLDELYEIKGNLEHEMRDGPPSYKQCFQGTNRRRTLLGIFMQAWQQRILPFCSIN
jgi:MFS transporter, SP family, sugar:H+ symporter